MLTSRHQDCEKTWPSCSVGVLSHTPKGCGFDPWLVCEQASDCFFSLINIDKNISLGWRFKKRLQEAYNMGNVHMSEICTQLKNFKIFTLGMWNSSHFERAKDTIFETTNRGTQKAKKSEFLHGVKMWIIIGGFQHWMLPNPSIFQLHFQQTFDC